MRSLFTAVVFAIAFGSLSPADDKKDEKKNPNPVGAFLVTANGFEIGKAFEADTRKARDDYSPTKPAPGVLGGRIVNINGVVAKVNRDSIQLATGNEWMILLKGKVEGTGPFVTITVTSIAIDAHGSKLAVLEGSISRSDKPYDRGVGNKE